MGSISCRYSSLVIFPDSRKPWVPAGRSVTFSITSRLRPRSFRSIGGAHLQVLRDTGDPPLEKADMWRRGAKLGIGDQLGIDELNDSTACLDRAGAGGDDVLHPLHV